MVVKELFIADKRVGTFTDLCENYYINVPTLNFSLYICGVNIDTQPLIFTTYGKENLMCS